MPKIKIIEGTTLGSKVVHPGEIHPVDDPTAALLISQKQASLYVEPPAPKKIELTLELLKLLKEKDQLGEVTVKDLQKFAEQKEIKLKSGLTKLEIVDELLKPEEVELTLELPKLLKEKDQLGEITVEELQEFAEQEGFELKSGLKLEIVEELFKHLND